MYIIVKCMVLLVSPKNSYLVEARTHHVMLRSGWLQIASSGDCDQPVDEEDAVGSAFIQSAPGGRSHGPFKQFFESLNPLPVSGP